MKSILLALLALTSFKLVISLEWNGNFANFPEKWAITKQYLTENRFKVTDPQGGNGIVLKVKYPKGTWSIDGHKGGTGFFVNPFGSLTNVEHAILEYDVYFPANFDFVKGGKLPGFYGGRSDCSGGDQALDCFSTRLMFGPNGSGYGYLYVSKQASHSKEFCDMLLPKSCSPQYGYGVGGGNYFVRDKWVRVKEEVKLNTVGQQNGRIAIWVDGALKFEFNKMVFRTTPVNITGIDFETFFGGATDDWATKKDEYSFFKNLKVTTF